MLEDERAVSLFNAVASGLIVTDADRNVLLWNAWMEAASGKPAGEVLGRELEAIFLEHSHEVLARAVRSAIEAGASTLLSHVLHRNLLPLKTSTGDRMAHDVQPWKRSNANRQLLLRRHPQRRRPLATFKLNRLFTILIQKVSERFNAKI